MKKSLLFGGIALCFLFGVQQGTAQCAANNLVANCGFETGDFTGWTTTGADVTNGQLGNLYGVEGADPDGTAPNSGSFQAYFGDLPSNAVTISQILSTSAGNAYLVSFFLAQDTTPSATTTTGNENGPNDFTATFGGVTLTNLTNIPLEGYTEYSFLTTASGPSTTLDLTFGNTSGFFQADDVSVTEVTPEPSSMVLLATGLAGIAWAGTRRKLFV
jgi:hypothetical protein